MRHPLHHNRISRFVVSGSKRGFLEEKPVDIVKGNMGWIEVVVGPMFSGKSEELIRRRGRGEIAGERVKVFKPAIDERYAANEIISHSGLGIASDNILKAGEILDKLQPRTEVIGIDEAQFLGDEVVEVCTKLANLGKRVIVAGLDTDYRGRPFEPMPRLLAIAEEITQLLPICVRCGNPAVHTQRLVESEELIVVGAMGAYEARCPRCFEPNPALAQATNHGPQLICRNPAAGAS